MRSLVLPLLATLCLTACSGGNSSPSGPSSTDAQVQGAWSGRSTLVGCTEAGGAVGVGCSGWPTSNSVALNLTQSGTAVSGTLSTGSFLFNVSGSVSGNSVTLTGQGRQSSTTFNLLNWSSTVSGSGMSGTFRYSVLPDDTRLGSVTINNSLSNVVR